MLLWILVLCAGPTVLGQLEDSLLGDDTDSDLADFDLDIVRHLNDTTLAHSGVWMWLCDRFCVRRRRAGSLGR